MKRIFGSENLKRRNLAKVLSIMMGMSSLVAPIVGCSFWDDDDDDSGSTTATTITPTTTPATTVDPEKNLTVDGNGVGNWAEFVKKAMTATTNPTTGATTYAVSTVLENVANIKGFSGRANYEQVKALLASTDYKKQYNTAGLSIYFDYVAKDGAGVEIIPSMLDSIYKYFDTVNITNVNDYGEKTPVKFSSGNATSPEIIDLEQFYTRVNTKKLTVPNDAIVTQDTTSVNLLGVADPYLRTVRVSDSARLVSLLQSPLFKNAKLDVLKLNGDIKPIMDLLVRENVAGNVMFDTNAYYQGAGQNSEDISIAKISEFVGRGANANIHDVNVVRDSSAATVNFSNAVMSNVAFVSNVDLSTLATGFDYVTAKGTLSFKGVLPVSMTYLDAEKVVFDGAIVSATGTDVTGVMIKDLHAKNVSNVVGFTQTEVTPVGSVSKYTGVRAYYDALKSVINISTDDIKWELYTKLILGKQSVYSV